MRLFLVGALLTLLSAAVAEAQVKIEIQPIQLQPGIGKLGQPLLPPQGLEQLKLMADQKDKYGKIEDEFKVKQKAAEEKYAAALKDRDRAKLQEAQQELTKTRTDSLAKVEAILSGEQKATLEKIKQQPARPGIGIVPIGPRVPPQILPPALQQRLNLTDEQKKKLDDLQKEMEEKVLKLLTD